MRYPFFFLMTLRPPISTLFPYTDALPILTSKTISGPPIALHPFRCDDEAIRQRTEHDRNEDNQDLRSEEYTSELQSREYLVCGLVLEKKTVTPTEVYTISSRTNIGL